MRRSRGTRRLVPALVALATALAAPAARAGDAKVALILDGPDLGAEAELAVRDRIGARGLPVLGRDAVEGVLAFAERPDAGWDAASLERLGGTASAAYVVLVESKPTGEQLALRVVVTAPGGAVNQFALVAPPEVPARAAGLVEEALGRALEQAPAPAPRPQPAAGATPTPAPAPTAEPAAPVAATAVASAGQGAPAATVTAAPVEGIEPPATRRPIPMPQPGAGFQELSSDELKSILDPSPLAASLMVGPALSWVTAPEVDTTFHGALNVRATLGYRGSRSWGPAATVMAISAEGGTTTYLGAGLVFNYDNSFSVGVIGNHFSIEDVFTLDLTAHNFPLGQLGGTGLYHSVSAGFSMYGAKENNGPLVGLFTLGWGIQHSSFGGMAKQLERYRKAAWERGGGADTL